MLAISLFWLKLSLPGRLICQVDPIWGLMINQSRYLSLPYCGPVGLDIAEDNQVYTFHVD